MPSKRPSKSARNTRAQRRRTGDGGAHAPAIEEAASQTSSVSPPPTRQRSGSVQDADLSQVIAPAVDLDFLQRNLEEGECSDSENPTPPPSPQTAAQFYTSVAQATPPSTPRAAPVAHATAQVASTAQAPATATAVQAAPAPRVSHPRPTVGVVDPLGSALMYPALPAGLTPQVAAVQQLQGALTARARNLLRMAWMPLETFRSEVQRLRQVRDEISALEKAGRRDDAKRLRNQLHMRPIPCPHLFCETEPMYELLYQAWATGNGRVLPSDAEGIRNKRISYAQARLSGTIDVQWLQEAIFGSHRFTSDVPRDQRVRIAAMQQTVDMREAYQARLRAGADVAPTLPAPVDTLSTSQGTLVPAVARDDQRSGQPHILACQDCQRSPAAIANWNEVSSFPECGNASCVAYWQRCVALAMDRYRDWMERMDSYVHETRTAAMRDGDDVRRLRDQMAASEQRLGDDYWSLLDDNRRLEQRVEDLETRLRAQEQELRILQRNRLGYQMQPYQPAAAPMPPAAMPYPGYWADPLGHWPGTAAAAPSYWCPAPRTARGAQHAPVDQEEEEGKEE